jgi:hypothetical protein
VSRRSATFNGYNGRMRQQWAKLIPAVFVGGCSLIYNENNIDKPSDARVIMDAPDAMIDANPSNLMLTTVESAPLLEGQGDGGSRAAVLVVKGMNIVAGATITVAATTGTAMIETVGDAVVSAQNDAIAIPVIAHVDTAFAAGASKELTITVTQPSAEGMTTQTIAWMLQGLGELEPGGAGNVTLTTTATPFRYSRVNITGTLTISGTQKAIIQSTSSISINAITGLNASTVTAGPGGGNGGAASGDGFGPGRGTKGNATAAGGGGAGFLTIGGDGVQNSGSGGPATGEVWITSYATNAGSGGGGGTSNGGGSGGTIELTAGGTLSAPAITANGAAGAGNVTTGGGGGSGGVIVLRSYAAATLAGALTVNGAAGGAGLLSAGGDGRSGRARVDAASITGTLGATSHRGFMFNTTAPLIVREPMPNLSATSAAGDRWDLHRVTPAVVSIDKTLVDFGAVTQLDTVKPTALSPGLNKLCAVHEGATLANDESRNCIDIAYIP